jgi:hypothetical protein
VLDERIPVIQCNEIDFQNGLEERGFLDVDVNDEVDSEVGMQE